MKKEEQSLTTSPVTAVPGNIKSLEDMLISNLRPGLICPHCNEERLDYDSMLNLVCPRCGLVMSGCFT